MVAVVTECYGGTVLVRHPGGGAVHFGVPPRGPFAERSARLAMMMIGGGNTVLETAGRLTLYIEQSGNLAGVGPGVAIRTGNQTWEAPIRIWAEAGQTITVDGSSQGARTIIGTPGGWQFDSEIGNANIQSVKNGQKLTAFASSGQQLSPLRIAMPIMGNPQEAAVIGLDQPLDLTVQAGSDRRGVRLKGSVKGQPGLPQSVPCVVGTVQLTPDGTVIVIGPDGPTIGGYHQLGVVASTNIEEISQWRVGDRVSLIPATLEQALDLKRAEEAAFKRITIGLAIGP